MVLFGKELTQLYDEQVCISKQRNRSTAKINREKDIKSLVEIVLQEDMFKVQPGRHFPSFHNFKHWTGVENAEKFHGRIVKHRNELADQLAKMAD